MERPGGDTIGVFGQVTLVSKERRISTMFLIGGTFRRSSTPKVWASASL